MLYTDGCQIKQYHVEGKIASGGMGDVYLATDRMLRRQVVLKILGAQGSPDEVVKLRFLHEAQSTAALNHPNIVTIYEVVEWEGQVFMAMEYIQGQTVADLVAGGALSPALSLDICIQLCDGLAAAHEAGITHRDIKPANIMADEKGRVTILDFGLARLEGTDHLTKAGALVGTVGYMSPEQGQGMQTDHRTDIFSAAVVLQEMLTGRNPFDRDSIPATIHAIVCEQPEPLLPDDESIPPSLQQVLDRALAKDSSDRYQAVSDFQADLREIKETGELSRDMRAVRRRSGARTRSLAVLHLRNPGTADDEYLCYGITEDLIVDLTRIGTIRVVPMRKVLKLKDSDDDIETIAKQLEADFVLDGSLHRSGDAVRVSAQLIDAASGENVWAERWEENYSRLPQIRQALADGIAHTMEVSRSAIRRADIRTPVPAKPEAYEYYLRGKYAFECKQNHRDSDIALNLYKKALAEDPSLLAARVGVAQVLMHRNEHEPACSELLEALTEARRRNSRSDEAMILRTLTQSQIVQSHWKRSMKFAGQALEICRAIGDLAGEAETLDLQIQILTNQAEFSEALKLLERVLEINRQLGDQLQTARALQTMGFLHIRRGDYVRGQALSRRAVALAREKGIRSVEAMCLKNIGITWEFMGKLDKAREHYGQALEIFTAIADNAGRAACLNNTANVYSAKGDYRKATEFYERAAEIQKRSGNRASYALSYNNISTPAIICGEYDKAVHVSQEALEIAQELDYPLVMHDANNCLGFAYFLKGDIEKAERFFGAALEVAEKGAIRRCEAMTRSHLGEMYYHLGDGTRCREYSDTALVISREIGIREFELKAAPYAAAQTCRDVGGENSLTQLRELVTETEEHGDPRYIVAAHRLLGQALAGSGGDQVSHDEGLTCLTGALEMAREKEIVYEQTWITAILTEYSRTPVPIPTT